MTRKHHGQPSPTSRSPPAIRSRYVDGINGLRMHVLEAGFETKGRPCLLLLHGFPELAFSWRKVMPALAAAGYHVIAPDQRGYGRTTGWDARLRRRSRARSACSIWCATRSGWCRRSATRRSMPWSAMISAAPVAAWCALMRPDVFRSVVLMSAPFGGPPPLPFNTADSRRKARGRRSRASRTRRAAAAAQALPMVLFDARGQRRHAPRAAGRA